MASTNGSSGSDGDGCNRLSRRISGLSPEKDAQKAACRLSSLRKQYCTQWEMPSHLLCSGCTHYLQSFDGKPANGKPRSETHGSRKYTCMKAWQLVEDLRKRIEQQGEHYRFSPKDKYILKVGQWMDDNARCNLGRWKTTPEEISHSLTKRALNDETPPSSSTTNEEPASEDTGNTMSDGRKVKKKKEDITVRQVTVKCQGHVFEIEGVPNIYTVVHKSRYQRYRNSFERVKSMEDCMSKTRYKNNGDPLSRSLLAVALSSAPALPISQAAHTMPMVVGSFLSNHGLLDNCQLDKYAKCFPSEAYLRDVMYSFAAENILELGQKLKGKYVFLGCDKGNKKGVTHFVKVLSWFDGTKVLKQCLDIDASEGTTEDCANAINASLMKVGVSKLQGQTTDSGGGGVLDTLATALARKSLCHSNYLVQSCSLHNLQLTIANPIKETMGEGGLDKRNLLQMLHSVYDMQSSVDTAVWQLLVTEAQEFMQQFGGQNNYNGATGADVLFAEKWNKVKSFRDFPVTLSDETKKKVLSKFQAPVLTRWWTVGESASIVFDVYLLLMKVSQSIINSNSGKNNKIASGLQPLLLEEDIYCDLALVSSYHHAYIVPHFSWMEGTTDLSGTPGFQTHNNVARYYLLNEDLETMKTTVATSHPLFDEYRTSLHLLTPQQQEKHKTKATKFISLAQDSLHKHYKRCMSKKLLPAALLSERPLASVVAIAMLQLPPETLATLSFDEVFPSAVHKRSIVLEDFLAFVRNNLVVDNEVYEPMALHVANMMLHEGTNIRDMTSPSIYHNWMYSTYLPLASHTQFVEAGVKEAKIVSTTDRSEPLRSAYAINRSARVHSASDKPLRELTANERVTALIQSAKDHIQVHDSLQKNVPDYKDRLADIQKAIQQDHYKHERVEKLKEVAMTKSGKNKMPNAIQQKSGTTKTLDTMGFVAYGRVKKAAHHGALIQELVHRGVCTVEEANATNFTELKRLLKDNEIARLKETEDKEVANRGFQPLSEALFPAS
jgi:hypothetical protein